MTDLIVVTGPPGAGKSTVASLVAARFDRAALIPGDAFFGFWVKGFITPWLPEAREQNDVVLNSAAAATASFVLGGCTAVYDGILGPWSLPAFLRATGLPRLHYAVLLPPLPECLHRVANRQGHGFQDPSATESMYAQFVQAQLEPRHVLAELPHRPGDVADLLLQRFAEGALVTPA